MLTSLSFNNYFLNTGFAVGNWWEVATFKLIRTTNAGANRHTLAQGEGDTYFDIYFASQNTGWIAGYNGLILKTTNGGSTFIKNENTPAESYYLGQNYPNPFNSITVIKFSVLRKGGLTGVKVSIKYSIYQAGKSQRLLMKI